MVVADEAPGQAIAVVSVSYLDEVIGELEADGVANSGLMASALCAQVSSPSLRWGSWLAKAETVYELRLGGALSATASLSPQKKGYAESR